MTAIRCSVVHLIALSAALLLPPPAQADPERATDALLPAPEAPAPAARVRVFEILDTLDAPQTGWLGQQLNRVGLSRYGLTYSRELDFGDGVELRFGGPRMRGSGDVGLSIELRF